MKILKPFQNLAVKFITSRKNCLLADVMGLGKTISTIGALNEIQPTNVLIVCPASIKEQWRQALKDESFIWAWRVHVVEGRDDNINLDNVVIVNYDLLSSPKIMEQLKSIKWSVGVYDEVHYCKSLEAKRTKAVFGRGGLVHCCTRNILLTGTPILNRPIEIYPMLKVLASDVLGAQDTYEKFGIKFCRGWYDGYELNVQGASNEEELNKRLKDSGFMLRRTEKEVELQLPQKRYQIFMVEGEQTNLRYLERMEREDFRKQRIGTDSPIATLRRELAERKCALSIGQISDIVAQVGKIVIFAYHKSVITQLEKEFEGMLVKIDGSCSQKQRQIALKMFQEFKDIKILVAQITAGGQGIDSLQNVCNHILFLEVPWVPAEMNQAIARCHRMGQTKSVLVQFILWDKSLETHMVRTMLDKQDVINKILI